MVELNWSAIFNPDQPLVETILRGTLKLSHPPRLPPGRRGLTRQAPLGDAAGSQAVARGAIRLACGGSPAAR
jgi:hypothetical protein